MDKFKPTTENAAENLDNPFNGKEPGMPWKLSVLRQKLNRKARQEPRFRFYTLYDHISRLRTLWTAWKRVKKNKGGPGLDGVTIKSIETPEFGVEGFLKEIQESLRNKKYQPKPVKRTYVPKPNGKMRPLGIPTIRDRVVQMATLLILEPIFEADFEDCSYGFRPKRSAHQALEEIQTHLKNGYCAVYDADLKGYFDSIPHDKLIACVEMRISDRQVIKLIRLWLECPVVEPGDKNSGPKISRSDKGTPQGGVISPMLANIYLHWFDKVFHKEDGPAKWANAKLVRYADDFLVLARYMGTPLVNFIEDKLEGWLDLEINRDKTSIVNLREDGARLTFLGYEYIFSPDLYGRPWKYLNMRPSKESLKRERDKLREMTNPRMCFKPLKGLIQEINVHLKGWSNYFGKGYCRKALREINSFCRKRLTRHAKRRNQRGKVKRHKDESYYAYLERQGLIYL